MNQTKLLLIDPKVENYDRLIPEVDPNTKVVILEPDRDGIEQISLHLSKCHQLETVHIISHGAKGALYLGNSILKNDNIHQYAESIQKWGKYLSAGGEILIYGCEVASGQSGREFVRQLHQLTGANIAASETLTGNVSIGGNWDLEVIFGQLKSALAFTPEVRESYAGVLANIVVDTTQDVVDNGDSFTSLREAIIQANSTPEDDIIQLTAGETYNLTISGSDEDAAATGDLDIVAGGGEITVISEGEEKAVIDAGGIEGISDRVFHVLQDGSLQLENVEVTGGFVAAAGGGIFNLGTVSISNSNISGNFSNRGGGGIFNSDTVSISNSNISGNSANPAGGGIENFGTANISDSNISGNSAGNGGGILNFASTTNISDSNISGNSAGSDGGGILNQFATANISNSTISGNSAGSNGGGIFNTDSTTNINNSTISGNLADDGGGILNLGTASISNSTISGNSADDGGGISIQSGTTSISNSTISDNSADDGGGIIIQSGTVTVTSSIVSGNINSDVDITGDNSNVISGDNNLVTRGNIGNGIESFYGDNDQTGFTDPLLGDLADNGGSTLTHLPLPNSPAIDAGSNPNALITDQRGEPRLAGEAVDIGAVELQNTQEIIGTPSSDILNGTGAQDRIFGLGGNDVISGLDGNDVLFGNEDLDTLNGDAGNDIIYGGKDNDLIVGNIGEDLLRGDRGNDLIFGFEGNDVAFGGKDSDSIDGGLGNDSISGDFGNDTLMGGQGIDTLTGGNDADIFQLAVGESLDIITDFVPEQDIILLDKTTFSAIISDSGTGFSLNAEFVIVTSDADAATSEAVIVYNSNNGKLFYNPNGAAAEFGSGGEFANLTNTASISGDDFFVRG